MADEMGIGGVTRRVLLRGLAAGLSATGALVSGCASLLGQEGEERPFPPLSCTPAGDGDEYDYIVVGSGAGGGPLAARLALAGFRVLVLEAGRLEDSYDYQVPAFHPRASEDERMAWNFFVRHYQDEEQQKKDWKYRPEAGGVLYPRAATVGGCTAHNAMILVYPHNSDWEHMADVTGDDSWRAEKMRRYFVRLERCGYESSEETASRHGFRGWLATNVADPMLMVRDKYLVSLVRATARESFVTMDDSLGQVGAKLKSGYDPNDWRLVEQGVEGVCLTPISTYRGRRVGSREFLAEAQAVCPENLTITTDALVSRVLLDEQNRATGVEYLSGASLYRADPRYREGNSPQAMRVFAKREVILAGGAFNTPQLLKLSGIGPENELRSVGITPRLVLPGVGENLQDRYEVCVVTKMNGAFSTVEGATFRPPREGEKGDPQFQAWLEGEGPYTTNGAVVSLIKRSKDERPEPDLFIFGLLGRFQGYYPGYSDDIRPDENYFTWAILKAHSNNAAGSVTLRSSDPTETPRIDFHYFDEGSDWAEDLESVAAGVDTVRRITARATGVIEEEIVPGPEVASSEEIRAYIKDNAWGHHASCTCKMGPASDPMAVVDSRFRVHGTQNLRVVDASVFPKIPGFFIASSVYMISEKASDVIIEDSGVVTAGQVAT